MTQLTALDRNRHGKLRVNEEQAFEVCKDHNMTSVVVSEIARLVIQYPVAFTRNGETGQFVCVALFGFDPSQNLYWHKGHWDGFCVPLNVGRHPFFVGLAGAAGDDASKQGLVTCVDLDNPAVQEGDGEALFDPAGKETPYLRHKLAILAELLDGEAKTREFIDKLQSLELIQPMRLEVKLAEDHVRKITGLYGIDDKRLRAIDKDNLAELHAKGFLPAIFAMMSSLGHFQTLMSRHRERTPGMPAAAPG